MKNNCWQEEEKIDKKTNQQAEKQNNLKTKDFWGGCANYYFK